MAKQPQKFLKASKKNVSEKKQKKGKKETQFPSISRLIPDIRTIAHLREVILQYGVPFCLSCLLIVSLVASYYALQTQITRRDTAREQREKVREEQKAWEEKIVAYPDYRDGYFTLALLSYQLGEIKKARDYVQKALSLDPNFTQAEEFLRTLEGKE